MDVRIVGNQFKIIKCDKKSIKNSITLFGDPWGPFWGPLGILWGSLGVVGGGLGSLSGPFGDPWGPLWAPLGVLGVCFADPWDPWGLLEHSRADFGIFLRNYGSPSGFSLASFWNVFSSLWKRRLFH